MGAGGEGERALPQTGWEATERFWTSRGQKAVLQGGHPGSSLKGGEEEALEDSRWNPGGGWLAPKGPGSKNS